MALNLMAIAGYTALGPAEQSLGSSVRVVYLHSAWIWSALLAFLAAALAGLSGLLLGKRSWQRWSRSLARTGLLFWVTYLPLSLWAMQTNWNGLFLAEPRWRVALVFAAGGLLLQASLALVDDLTWDSLANPAFTLILTWSLAATENVLHPGVPILRSESIRIQLYAGGLLLLTCLLAWQAAHWLQRSNSATEISAIR